MRAPGLGGLALFALVLWAAGCAKNAEMPLSGKVGAAPRTATAKAPRPAPQKEAPPGPAHTAARLSEKGERAYRQENYRSAERNFKAALRIAPTHFHALTGLAWTLYDSGRPHEAFPLFKKAHKRFPKDGSARRGLAYLYYRYGRHDDARTLLGTLDKERWPELANIDDEIRARALKGPPAPKTPGKSAPRAEPAKRKRARAASPPKAPVKKKRPSPRLSRARAWRPPFAQRPSFKNMVLVPGGSFMMGEDVLARRRNGRRRGRRYRRWRARRRAAFNKGVRVRVHPFRLDKFEATNALYAAFVKETGTREPPYWRLPHFAGPHRPVVGVTWHEARAYCRWAKKRLPTEAEWEYAARGGAKGRAYPWGNRFRGRNAVYGLRPDTGGPKAVGRRPQGASLHGVEDMAGNVWEWTEDAYRVEPSSAPLLRNGQMYRTLRGGSWVNGRWAMTATSRTGDLPQKRLPVYGFRCAANVP